MDANLGIEAHIHFHSDVCLAHRPNAPLWDFGAELDVLAVSFDVRVHERAERQNGECLGVARPRVRRVLRIDPTPCPSNTGSTSMWMKAMNPGFW